MKRKDYTKCGCTKEQNEFMNEEVLLGNLALVKKLVKSGLNPDFTTKCIGDSYSPIYLAIANGHKEIVSWLLDSNSVKPSQKILGWASLSNDAIMIQLIFDKL